MKPIFYWLSAAFTVFFNGVIAGLPSGGVGGALVGVADQGHGRLWPIVMGVLLPACANGYKRVIVWHDANEFPNPFPQPTVPVLSNPQGSQS